MRTMTKEQTDSNIWTWFGQSCGDAGNDREYRKRRFKGESNREDITQD